MAAPSPTNAGALQNRLRRAVRRLARSLRGAASGAGGLLVLVPARRPEPACALQDMERLRGDMETLGRDFRRVLEGDAGAGHRRRPAKPRIRPATKPGGASAPAETRSRGSDS